KRTIPFHQVPRAGTRRAEEAEFEFGAGHKDNIAGAVGARRTAQVSHVNQAERAIRNIRREHAVGTLHPKTVVSGVVGPDIGHAAPANFEPARAAVWSKKDSGARSKFATGQRTKALCADAVAKTDAHRRRAANRSVARRIEQATADIQSADAAGIQADF